MIKLKITIPTYNRPEFIRRQVRDLLPQLRDGVSLIVYDNYSDIPVESLFNSGELEHFIIVRNKFNIGGAANIGKCLSENGESGWIWLLGDDDKIAPNAVETILETIKNNQDCCYINFQQKKTVKTENLYDFLAYMRIMGAFGVSFFQSACLFNMDKLQNSVMYYYEYMSSWVGQIAMVIKYLDINRTEKCLFTTQKIITGANVGGWSHLEIIINSSILLEKFRYLKPIMKTTLFKAIPDMDYTLLSQAESPIKVKLRYCSFIISRFGLFNVIKNNYISFAQFLLSVILPKRLFQSFRKKVAIRYNKKVNNE